MNSEIEEYGEYLYRYLASITHEFWHFEATRMANALDHYKSDNLSYIVDLTHDIYNFYTVNVHVLENLPKYVEYMKRLHDLQTQSIYKSAILLLVDKLTDYIIVM